MNRLEEKSISTETIFTGKVIQLQVDEVELPNGKTSTREIVKHPGAVAIIPITNDEKIVMVEQYRAPLGKVIVEIPAGKLEQGEQPLHTASRELEEETGYTCEELQWLTCFYTSPGFADELVHIYIAKGLSKIEEPAMLDEDEFVNVIEVDLDEAIQLMAQQKIHDAKTAYAITYLQLQEAMKK